MHVSSAYRFDAVSFKAYGRSLIHIKKRSGSRIETCGTPHVIKGGEGLDIVIIINNRGGWNNREGWTGLK